MITRTWLPTVLKEQQKTIPMEGLAPHGLPSGSQFRVSQQNDYPSGFRPLRVPMVLELLTTLCGVVILSNMAAELLLSERRILSESAFVKMVVWRLPRPRRGSIHALKYRLAAEALLRDFWKDVENWGV